MNPSIDIHCLNLGRLLANFQTLELYIRAVLSECPGAAYHGLKPNENIYDCVVGCELNESPMTNFDSLSDLIKGFNKAADAAGWEKIDPTLVSIRDALAHGRIAYSDPQDPHPRLMKFSRPQAGKVQVTFNEKMSHAWFEKHIARVYKAISLMEKYSYELREQKKGGNAQ